MSESPSPRPPVFATPRQCPPGILMTGIGQGKVLLLIDVGVISAGASDATGPGAKCDPVENMPQVSQRFSNSQPLHSRRVILHL